ncbi:MAG: hypothetical protein MUE72_11265 [Chitinophagaceae bacterium]|nr:hypothetical protein [Chitinophagaceae bacterium]
MSEEIIQHAHDEITFKEFLGKLILFIKYLKTQLLKLIVFSIIGGCIGLVYTYISPTTYTAKLSFVVEDTKVSGGGLAALAGQFGFDVPGAGSGLLNGDNILLFLKSESLISATLLSVYDSSRNYSLADKYADLYELRKNWANNKKINQKVFFPVHSKYSYTRLQDSLLQVIVKKIALKELTVVRPEKKATFINVTTTMRDELLSKWFCERLVNEACNRYIYSKIKRQKTNVDRLQKRADSLVQLLNYKTYASANENEKLVDINPALKTQAVNAEVTGRDKIMLSTIFAEVVKNLEISKIQLNQETPTIYMVDDVNLPLVAEKKSKIVFTIFSFALSFLLGVFILGLRAIRL